MRTSGEPVPEIAKTLGVSRPIMYRLLAEGHA
jgi:predicted DNA-binding transcriptional regulator AlpA